MHPQRAIMTPAFYHEFMPLFYALLESCSEYQVNVLDWQLKFNLEMKNHLDEVTRLNAAQASAAAPITQNTWGTLDRQRESLELEKKQRLIGADNLKFSIEAACARIFAYYSEIVDDFNGCYMAITEYKKYLECYRSLLENSNNFECFKAAPASDILKGIQTHLVPLSALSVKQNEKIAKTIIK